jgi:tetratricopeptide (TPR) repeat protein
VSSPRKVFVGRRRELSELESGLDDARTGRGGLFLLAGEAGIGKTRLADELAERARARGFSVRWGRCWEVGGAPAYWPWIQVLRGLLRDAGDLAFEAGTGEALARLLPELGGAPAEDGAGDASHERFRLFDAVTTAMRDATRAKPMLVILDDLHAADPSSLALLLFVARELRDSRLSVLATYRDQEARLGPDRGEALARIAREATYLPLQRFDRKEIAALLEARAGSAADDDLVSAVVTSTEGHPLFVDEVERALATGKHRTPAGKLSVPQTVRAAIHDRLALLDPRTREALEVAAVLGREVVSSTFAELLGIEVARMKELLRPALVSGLLVDIEPELFGFSHAMVRDALYRDLSAARRADLHARAAMILEREGALETAQGEIANHLLEAVSTVGAKRALDGSERAARRAMSTFAFEDAVAILEKALRVLEPIDDPRALARTLILLGEARARAHLDGSEACRRAAALARQLGDGELLARAALALGAEITIATVSGLLVELLREALGMLPEAPSVLRARALARLAGALQPAPDPMGPVALAREAIAMARALGDEETLRVVLLGAGAALVDYVDPEERLDVDGEMLKLSERAGDRPHAFRARLRLFFDNAEIGDLASMDEHLRAITLLAEKIGRPRHRFYAAALKAVRALQEGRFEEADRLENEARAEMSRADEGSLAFSMTFHRFAKLLVRHDHARLRESIPEAPPSLSDQAPARIYRELFASLASVRLGDLDAARARIAALDPHDPFLRSETLALTLLAEIYERTGMRERAEVVLRWLAPHRGRFMSWGPFGLAVLGPYTATTARLEAMLGHWDEARRDFENAISKATALGARPALAEIHCEYARALVARGTDADRARGAEHLARGLAIARELGMAGLVAFAESPSAPAAAPAASSALPFNLERQGDVWLVTRGARSFHVKDTRGLHLLAELVAKPGREMHALALGGGDPGELGDAGEVLDDRAALAYRERLEDLREMEREAEEMGDSARLAKARDEIEKLAEQLSAGLGLGGRARRAGSIAERARTNVQRRIKDAIQRIEKNDAELGRYLSATIRTGTFCMFDPERSPNFK